MRPWKILFAFFKPHWRWLLLGTLLVSFNVAMQLPMPLLTMYLIDHVIPEANFKTLHYIGFALIVSILCRAVLSHYLSFVFAKFRNNVICDIRSDIFYRVTRLPMSFFDKYNAGYLGSRVTGELNSLQQLMASTFIKSLQDIFTLMFGLFFIFKLNYQLAIISLIPLPFFLVLLKKFNPKQREISRKKKEASSRVMGDLLETFSCIYVVKAFVAEVRELTKMVKSLKAALSLEFDLTMTGNYVNIGTTLLNSAGKLALIWYGCAQIMEGKFSLGSFLAFNSFLRYVYDPTQSLMNTSTNVQDGLASLDRMIQLVDIPVELELGDSSGKLLSVKEGAISFNQVSFSYGQEPVLHEISFEIFPKTTVAFVGKSGSGKSTLIKLILGMYHQYSGKILIDGQEIHEVDLRSLRSQIGLIPQDTYLFSGDVLFNLSYGNPLATRDEIVFAAKAAYADDFITNLPNGYETQIGERGTKLSGGQRQRISIGMAFLKNAPILILDEATASLDGETERQIKQSIEKLSKDKTTLIIAHRLSTVIDADQILVLDGGRIVGIGNHNDLILNNLYYQKIFQSFEP